MLYCREGKEWELNTPFIDAIVAVSRRGPRFFVPGHKGNAAALPLFAELLPFDLTEVEGAFDLSHPTGALAASQQNMARLFGSEASLYSASGSTSCIMAMLAAFVPAGGGVVMVRGCHVAALRALAVLDATPHWAVPGPDGKPDPKEIDDALAHSGAKAVYLTSVDYCGNIPDIAAIAAVCHKHGAFLLCDNAHGAHLRFFDADLHPLALGADACADSAHKTLPCLTPAALLHLREAALQQTARDWLNFFSSTSPAYPVLLSLDWAAGLLASPAAPDFAAAAARLAEAATAAGGAHVPCDDPLRLLLRPALAGFDWGMYRASLLEKGFAPEYGDGQTLVFMASPANSEADFAALETAIAATHAQLAAARHRQTHPISITAIHRSEDPPPRARLPQVAMPVRTALFGPKRRVPVARAVGLVCAGLHAPCPPGVPCVVPGEVIGESEAAQLCAGGILQVDVVK